MAQGTARIPLRRRDGTVRAWTTVDAADLAPLSAWRWSLTDNGYVKRVESVNGKLRQVYMHRQVLGLTRGDRLEADHHNGDRLDNRRANLLVKARQPNGCNLGSAGRGPTSAYRGVSWDRTRGRWLAQARYRYRKIALGRFGVEQDAAAAVAAFWASVGHPLVERRAA